MTTTPDGPTADTQFGDMVLAAIHTTLPSAVISVLTVEVAGIQRLPISTILFAKEILATCTPAPSPDTAEGERCTLCGLDLNEHHPWKAGRVCANFTAPPKPAPDALRKAIRDAIGLCQSEAARWRGDKTGAHWSGVAKILRAEFFMDEMIEEARTNTRNERRDVTESERIDSGIMNTVLSSAPVPSPDGAGDNPRRPSWCSYGICNFPNCSCDLLTEEQRPSPAGAAEPVAWRWKYTSVPEMKWMLADQKIAEPCPNITQEPLYAIPPVMVDREAIARALYEIQPAEDQAGSDGQPIPWSALASFCKELHYKQADAILSLHSPDRNSLVRACQCCGTVAPLRCGPSRFGPQTWACEACWNPDALSATTDASTGGGK